MSAQFETFGKYVLLEKLATGGMAEVFLARGTGAGGIGKFFAIKRILPQYADSPEFIEMFKDEAKIAINLNHSNIVSIHEFGVEKGQFFLVMDYVEGRNLRQILNKMKKVGQQFTIEQIVYIIKEVAAGLDHAHRCIDGSTGKPLNITHRDMSPQNVMTSFEGEVKIVDFGIAKAESQIETTRAGTLKGKFGYMSPEQAEGQPVDLRTDIFSLGIVMWELLANDRLFVANNEINTLRKIRDCQIPSLRKINPNLHSEIERIAQKALARDRNLRYQTGAALHRDLNRFLNRQYPDFSPQDFAISIKNVFADEILGLRKRLVEYAKLNIAKANGNDREFDDRTSLLETGTNSLIVSDSQVYDDDEDSDTVENDTDETRAEPAEVSQSSDLLEVSNVSNVTHTEIGDPKKAGVLDEAALMREANVKRGGHGKSKLMPLDPPPIQPAHDTQHTNPQSIPGLQHQGLETEEVSSPSIRGPKHPRMARSEVLVQSEARPARFATFFVFTLLCVSVYTYLCKFYPDVMSPAIQATDPVLYGFHNMLGIGREVANDGRNRNTPSVPLDPPPHPSFNTLKSLMISSNPSGGEIWIDGRNTGKTTPQMLENPPEGAFTLSIRRRGYFEYKRADVTREALGHKVEATLEKMNVGYLDIEIFPPQEAILFINGKQVAVRRTIARDVVVPANRPIRVRAESRNGDTYDEVSVIVPLDRKKSLRINPRKNTRVPAGG